MSQGSHDGWTDESASSPRDTIEFQREIILLINNAAIKSQELKTFLESIDFPSRESDILQYIWADSLHDNVWIQEQPFPPQDSDGPTELRWHTIYRLATDEYKYQLITRTPHMRAMYDPNFKWMPHTGGKRKRKTVIKKYRKKTVKRRTKKRKIHK